MKLINWNAKFQKLSYFKIQFSGLRSISNHFYNFHINLLYYLYDLKYFNDMKVNL